ncbi:MAG: helix-turn-helix domain-containing protein [Actinomycetota bacterium]
MRFSDLADQPCSISRSLAILGERWTLVILKQAFAGTRRFDDFVATTGISRSRLTTRLNELVEHGILERVEYKDTRTRSEYRLTQRGHDVYPILMALRGWGDAHLAPDGPPLRYLHTDCGGEVRSHLSCERCEEPLVARDITVDLGPGFPT